MVRHVCDNAPRVIVGMSMVGKQMFYIRLAVIEVIIVGILT